MKLTIRTFILLLSICLSVNAGDSLRLPYIFRDGAVLQRQKPVPVWGWASSGAEIEVRFSGQSKSSRADGEGYWKVELDPMEANADGQELSVTTGAEKIVVEDVVVGEVWIAAGQSNMNHSAPDFDTGVYPFYQSPPDEAELPRVRYRFFGKGASLEPQKDVQAMFRDPESRWMAKEDYPEGSSTNLAQYFARIIRDELEVPVGIIHVAVSGINQTAWLSRETMESFPGAEPYANYYEEFLTERAEDLAKGGEIRSWDDFLKAEDMWSRDSKGSWPGKGMTYVSFPTTLYNTRIFPLAPYAVRGVIWSHGAAGPRGPYAERTVAMIQQWRKLFGQDFAFIWTTLNKITTSQPPLEPVRSSFYRSAMNGQLRLVRDLLEDDPQVEYVEIYDIGNENSHFGQKAEAGRRMAAAALTKIYHKPSIYTGPRMLESEFRGSAAMLAFSHVGEGLVYEPSINGISGFIVHGEGSTAWAEVRKVDAHTIVCSHPEGKKLDYVGYGLAINPHETLFNSDGIPATPFAITEGDVEIPEAEENYTLLKPLTSMRGANLHMAHVRRNGYIFEIRLGRKANIRSVSVRAYVSPEWSGVSVEADGRSVTYEVLEENGKKFIKFDAPAGGKRIIVANTDEMESFRNVNRY